MVIHLYGLGLWCLTVFLVEEYEEKSTDLLQVTDKTFCIVLFPPRLSEIRTQR